MTGRGAITVRPLSPQDDRSGFSCGQTDLDRFFRRYAGQNQFKHHVGVTYVAVGATDGQSDVGILGFATISASQLETTLLPPTLRRRMPRYPLPVLRLARLAVDREAQGRGVGLTLLRSVFVLARRMAKSVGCVGVLVDAKPDATTFYERYGFTVLEGMVVGELGDRPKPAPMFLPLALIPE